MNLKTIKLLLEASVGTDVHFRMSPKQCNDVLSEISNLESTIENLKSEVLSLRHLCGMTDSNSGIPDIK